MSIVFAKSTVDCETDVLSICMFLGRTCAHELTTAFLMRNTSRKNFESEETGFVIDYTID
jgi:hypothetical protein